MQNHLRLPRQEAGQINFPPQPTGDQTDRLAPTELWGGPVVQSKYTAEIQQPELSSLPEEGQDSGVLIQ